MSVKKVTYKTYNGISFPLMTLFTLVLLLIFRAPLSWDLFKGKLLLFLLLAVIITIITNLIFYRALKSDNLSEMETISLLTQIPLIIFASIFFKDERNILVLVLALIAVSSIIWSHWKRHHFAIARKTWPFLIWALLVAPFRGLISKVLLESWNPISLQLVENFLICLVFVPLFYKSIKSVPKKAIIFLIITNILTTVAWILYYFSYQMSGVVYTVMIFSLQPVLVYISSLIFLKDKLDWKKLVAFGIILVTIIVAQIF
jgi:transporter family protein